MLTISKALSSSQAQSYHKLEFTSDAQNYYKQGDTVKGEWQGKLAASLGLSGEVSPSEFHRLSEGMHPQTEEHMVKHRLAQEYTNEDGTTTKAVEHRAGWDATFSAPKSVSLSALVGGDERVRDAHRAAVATALDELERYTHARIGGNNPAEQTGKFIAAKFEHDTARPVDGYAAPQLHTHAVIFNVTERADGSTRALQERAFFESQQYATAVYQSALTYQLRNLGYEIEAGKSGAPEIKGYSREYLDASSPRSQQIKDQLEKTGHSGPEAAQIAAHSTRDRKQTLTPEEVLTAHKDMAADFGNQPQKVVAAARERAEQQELRQENSTQAKEAITFARESIFEREAVADERAILRDALRRGMGEATYGEIRSEFDRRREAGDFRSVQGEKYSSGRSFTTPETIAAERANVRHVLDGRNTVTPIMGAEQAREQANTRDFLNDSQRKSIEEILNSSDRIHGLQGLAGTGKTTTLEVIREGAEKNSYTVEGFAPSSKAAGQLREAGIDANTLQSFLARGENHPNANPEIKHLYLLDESSLASTRQMRAFLDKLNPDDRVLVIGDTRQHQGVDAGKPFEQMQEAGMQTSHLDKIMRQKDPELLKAVQHLANDETEKGIAMLAEQGRVSEITNGQERINAIAKDYATRPENTIIVSPDNKSRQQINEAVRGELLQQCTLADDGQKFSTLAHRSDMTGADRTWAARYNVGEVLQYATGSKAEGIERDSFATVRSVDSRANTLTVELENGSSVTYDPRRLRGVNVFRETEREFATGDRIQFTAPNKDLGLANRDLGTVLGLEDEKMTVRLDGKAERTVTFDAAEFRQFDHGYAVTSHSSQGLTAGRVIANIDTESSNSLINTRLAYVAISRASEDARIYTNNAETLGERLATDNSKTAALDFKQPSSSEQTRLAVEAFRNNDPATATELLQQQGRIYEYANPDHRLAAVALDYAAQPDRAVIVVADPADRRELTQLIRDDLHAQGRLTESRSVSVLVEQEFGNPRLAANYSPGDEIHYKKGSPEEHGIIHNSTATVIAVDISKNLLTVETRSGEQASYNPALLKQQTGQSTVYRAEERDLAVGDRIQFTVPDLENRIHSGDLATVERMGEDNALSVRLDNGKDIELSPEKARHIEHGYSVETAKYISADRVLITGESSQLAEQQVAFTKLNPNIHELAIYTSDRTNLLERDNGIGKEPQLSNVGLSNDSSLSNGPEPSGPSIEREGYGIGL
ncbi:MobF family relaxase [Tunturiibacter gelidoferens]|uniref:Conjugative relaxase-like TrwC/TraI family protein n=1 Tax=Tunturiibacter gelidiferens TaxID=3069689 RepID=A0ACC5P5S9_9BACT|nr:MobF family relaxase [Edaphobacter lichenicola]MBB5342021.1 conjugative relaxase-like TrwC/TraI family protein [Edaphobacter lichenicola]